MFKVGQFDVGDLAINYSDDHLCIVIEKEVPKYDTYLPQSNCVWYRIKRLDKRDFILDNYGNFDERPFLWVRDFDLLKV